MPYTLAKWALWLISAAVAGFVVGWMLRGLRRGASSDTTDDQVEFEPPPDRSAALQPLLDERDELVAQLAKCRELADAPTPAAVFEPSRRDDSVDQEAAQKVAEHLATIGDLRARLWNTEARVGELMDALAAQQAASAPQDPDLVAGAAVLGEKVRLNDLTVVEGIGPKIADALLASGIKTWWQLHLATSDQLRRVLAEAGQRFQVHDPTTWPEQAGLLARGEWQQFQLLTERLQAGRTVD